MITAGRRTFFRNAVSLVAGGALAGSQVAHRGSALAQAVPGSVQFGVKALFFDVFGTLVDWRTGVAREAEVHLKPRGYAIDWLAFADAWRAEYQPGMEKSVRAAFRFLGLMFCIAACWTASCHASASRICRKTLFVV